MKKIVLVEDDVALRENYTEALKSQGYHVTGYDNRADAEKALNERLPDLVIIDIGLKHEHDGGFRLCQALRQISASLPIIFFTARDNDIDTVCGLRMGADDYLTKDISLPHLLARISALFRRLELSNKPIDQSSIIHVDELSIDSNRMQVSWRDVPVDLTVTEFWMLFSLAKHHGHVKSRQQLMDDSKMVVDDTTITSHIKRIRQKFVQIDPHFDAIETLYGMGYRWRSPTTS
ncbi:proteobacterial dedicated sortase system response regulator [Alteromonas oceanisediminis]|uniref:proteobacterial dedicated sortase system response regulator n=1 Tax=Alteromonas oceanisediminis TaxID=2836180 RepID=UPI001BD9C472|nr:proteobacterial dedicated sortase system response regulator [Alteromonas oceanisediminis]MBT0587673.1 proteobacterial dedicated sortase system response regulator [Alteromonas oceanisediminis]